MKLRGFTLGRPQAVAALFLFFLLAECVWTIAREPLNSADYRYAHCGREMWEAPSALTGYFTTCGNLNGDGTFGYRLTGLPLSAERLALLSIDHFRKPQNRLYAEGSLNGSMWEARHELVYTKWILRLPFVLFALWLGGGLWWVARRLFGNEGGAFAVALYSFCPAIVRYGTHPNNEILALWGLYGLVYTAIGVAHALQGPRSKWRPRIILLAAALGLTAAAHTLAGLLGFALGLAFMLYLAQRRRHFVLEIQTWSVLGAVVVLFAFFSFRFSAFLYVFTGGSARFWFSLASAQYLFRSPANAAITAAAAIALVLYVTTRRSRFFGNTAPLLVTLVLLPLYTSQVVTAPWLWALPFLFTWIGGVFADAFETKNRKLFLVLAGAVILTQAVVCWFTLLTRANI